MLPSRMFHLNLDARRPHEALGEVLGHVHGPVVSAVAAERHLQVVAAILEIHLYRLAHKHLSRIEEMTHQRLIPLEEIKHRLVESGITAQGHVIVRIRQQSAIKDEPTPVVIIGGLRHAIGIGERDD